MFQPFSFAVHIPLKQPKLNVRLVNNIQIEYQQLFKWEIIPSFSLYLLYRRETLIKDIKVSHSEAIQQKDACNGQLGQDNTNLKRHIIKLRSERSRLQSAALTAQEGAPREMENSGRAAKEDRVLWGDLAKLQEGL